MTGHRRFEQLLAYRRQLSPGQQEELDTHLASCSRCRARARVYAAQDVHLSVLAPKGRDRMVDTRVLSRIDQPNANRSTPHPRGTLTFMAAGLVASILLLALLVKVTPLLSVLGDDTPAAPQSALLLPPCDAARGWRANHPCLLSSPDQFLVPGARLFAQSLNVTHRYLRNPVYVVHSASSLPLDIAPHTTGLYFQPVGTNTRRGEVLYAVGTVNP